MKAVAVGAPLCLALAALPMAAAASPQLFVAADDGEQILVDGVQTVPLHPAADKVTPGPAGLAAGDQA